MLSNSLVRRLNRTSEPREDPMLRLLWEWVKQEQGQDMVEYTLLVAMVALASAGLFINSGGTISGIWSVTSSNLSTANSLAS